MRPMFSESRSPSFGVLPVTESLEVRGGLRGSERRRRTRYPPSTKRPALPVQWVTVIVV